MSQRTCADCGTDISERHWRSKRCEPCQRERERQAMNTKAKTTYARNCAECSKPFAAAAKHTRFCSNSCAGKGGHPGNISRDCIVCDKTFTVSRQFDRDTCSRTCLRFATLNPGRKPVRECRWCGGSLKGKSLRAEWCNARCWHAQREGVSWEWIQSRRCLVCDEAIPREAHYHRNVCSDLCKGRRPRSPEVIFRQTHARRKNMDAAKLYRVPRSFIRKLRTLPCIYCGGRGGTADHVIPISRGGKHAEGNLVPACRSCNSSKGALLLIEWRRRKGIVLAA